MIEIEPQMDKTFSLRAWATIASIVEPIEHALGSYRSGAIMRLRLADGSGGYRFWASPPPPLAALDETVQALLLDAGSVALPDAIGDLHQFVSDLDEYGSWLARHRDDDQLFHPQTEHRTEAEFNAAYGALDSVRDLSDLIDRLGAVSSRILSAGEIAFPQAVPSAA